MWQYLDSTNGAVQMAFLPPHSHDLNPAEFLWARWDLPVPQGPTMSAPHAKFSCHAHSTVSTAHENRGAMRLPVAHKGQDHQTHSGISVAYQVVTATGIDAPRLVRQYA